MQIMIDISEDDYRKVQDGRASVSMMRKAIRNGTPLSKGHGRLIDADSFKKNICTYQQTGCGDCKHSLCCPEDEPTIIEADNAENEVQDAT